jgi:hypothetical protein
MMPMPMPTSAAAAGERRHPDPVRSTAMGDGSRDRFARQAAILLRVAGGTDIEYDADEFCLRFIRPGGSPLVANLANLFRECDGEPHADQMATIRKFMTTMVNTPGMPDDWAEVAPSLLPVLNATEYARWNENDPERQHPLSREVLPFAHEMVAVDRPDSIAYVVRGQLDDWGVSAAEVFDRARANLAARARWQIIPEPSENRTIYRMPESGSDYWASHLLLDGWLAGVGEQLGARPVMFVADRSGITIIADEPDVVGSMLEMTEETYMSASKPVSTQAFTVDGAGRVVPYTVPRGDPMWNAVHRSELAVAARQYGLQHKEHDFSIEGFVADYMVKTEDDGRMWSVAVWGEDVVTLLPRADYVAVINEAREHVTVPWDDVVRITGIQRQPGWEPPRWLAGTWPSEAQHSALRAAAVEP